MTLLVLDAGGTMTSRPDNHGALAGGASPDRLAPLLPGDADAVEIRQIFTGLSEEMRYPDMAQLVRAICDAERDPNIAGVVVVHGTDIMEETAFLADLSVSCVKPVIFTGAQRPALAERSDAFGNLRDAMTAARHPGLARHGVLIAFGGRLIPAKQACKWHTTSPDGFAARNGDEGWIREGKVTPPPTVSRPPPLPAVVPDDRVEAILLGAAASDRLVRAAVDAGCKGIVLSALGAGNAPAAVCTAVGEVARRGVPVLVCSRCPAGACAPNYSSGRALIEAGAISAQTLGASQARVLLAVLLAMHETVDATRTAIARHL
jgi:L-asparaginase